MKKILLTVAVLAVALGASSLVAQNTNWSGTYWGDPTGTAAYNGIWKGIIYDDPMGPAAPHFEGKWASDNNVDSGTLYATLASNGQGIYKIKKGIIYDQKGIEIGNWVGIFDLVSTDPGLADGEWTITNDPSAIHHGFWKGIQVFPGDEE